MKDNQEPIPSIHDVLGPALHKAFLRAAELAKQTRTYLVVQEGDRIRHVSYEEIDAFVAERNIFKERK
ncbi:MAG TPA: hypothetical protein VHE99_04055 [Gammaproteobacteria bacterium]|nr:hypothetical protein [Gammaproteobacteria bacterium]